MMKNIYKIVAFLAVVLFTACQDDELVKEIEKPVQVGDEIMFGASAGFEISNPESRTEYGGTVIDGREPINWTEGDQVEIYCNEAASSVKTTHYTVQTGTDNGSTYLVKNGDSSLQWGSNDPHTFYAMYPSSQMFTVDQSTLAQGVKMDGTKLTGIIPAAQNPASITETNGNYVVAPDMKYAYMAARSTATRADGSVNLNFVPIVTAVQIELIVPASEGVLPVSIGEIQVQGSGIAGGFTADLSGWKETYPECENLDGGSSSIQIPVWDDNKAITLAAGKSLTFTVFLRPEANIEDLKVYISPNGAGYIGKALGTETNKVTVVKNKKNIFKNLKLPAVQEAIVIDASKWMSQLSGDLELKKLSIPGTGGSFSYNYNSSNPEWYKQQTLTLDEQWTAGIRAFEIVSDRPSSSTTTLGTQNVKCNKVSMGVTVLSVLQQLLQKVTANNTETAVLILTYQPEGVYGNERNAPNYASSLKLMYDGLTDTEKNKIIQYTPNLTLAEAKGNVMIFCRINQRDEADADDVTTDGATKNAFQQASDILAGTNITLIDGCGTGKDRWGSRGYKVNGNVAYDAANTGDAQKSVDYYLTQQGSIWNYSWPEWSNVKIPTTNDLNFGFGTNYNTITCWYQEWARVVHSEIVGSNGYYQVVRSGITGDGTYPDYRWYESYNEKLNAAKETFAMAISDKYPSYIFINSLCGYLVDSSIESSYTIFTGSNTGGIAGNIKALADKLNPAFYQYVLGAGLENATGPTGIVMMDYVTNKPTEGVEYDGAYYLPGVIIANNFKYGNGNSGSGNTGGGNGDTENSGGGNGDTENPGGGNGEEGI